MNDTCYKGSDFDRSIIPVSIRTAVKEDLNWVNSQGQFKIKIGLPFWVKTNGRFVLDWIRFNPDKEERELLKERLRRLVRNKQLYILDIDFDRCLQKRSFSNLKQDDLQSVAKLLHRGN